MSLISFMPKDSKYLARTPVERYNTTTHALAYLPNPFSRYISDRYTHEAWSGLVQLTASLAKLDECKRVSCLFDATGEALASRTRRVCTWLTRVVVQPFQAKDGAWVSFGFPRLAKDLQAGAKARTDSWMECAVRSLLCESRASSVCDKERRCVDTRSLSPTLSTFGRACDLAQPLHSLRSFALTSTRTRTPGRTSRPPHQCADLRHTSCLRLLRSAGHCLTGKPSRAKAKPWPQGSNVNCASSSAHLLNPITFAHSKDSCSSSQWRCCC